MQITPSLVEECARAHWNMYATVLWDEFFHRHPEKKEFYLATMRAALERFAR